MGIVSHGRGRRPVAGWLLIVSLVLALALAACTGAAPAEEEEEAPEPEAEVEEEAEPEPEPEIQEEEAAEEEEPAEEEMMVHDVKIGVLNPTTGGLAIFGEMSNAGINLYFDNHEVEGANVELVFADTAGDPQQAIEQARRLVEQEEVDFLLGLVNSAVSVPMAQFANEEEVPLLMAIAGAQGATGPDNTYVYRTGMANGQQDRPLGWYTATELGHTSAATFAWDFLVGEERAGGFGETFTAGGGSIVAEIKPPLATTDYGPFVSQIDPSSTEVVYAFVAGPGAIAFMQQMSEFGLTPGIQVVGSGFLTAGVLGAMGETALDVVQGAAFTPVLDNPENAEFQALYAAAADGGVGGVYIAEGYQAAQAADLAIEAVGGDLSDKQAFLDALGGLEFDGVAGPIRFDDNGQSVRNVYITRVVATDAGVGQEIIDVIEGVGMDWAP